MDPDVGDVKQHDPQPRDPLRAISMRMSGRLPYRSYQATRRTTPSSRLTDLPAVHHDIDRRGRRRRRARARGTGSGIEARSTTPGTFLERVVVLRAPAERLERRSDPIGRLVVGDEDRLGHGQPEGERPHAGEERRGEGRPVPALAAARRRPIRRVVARRRREVDDASDPVRWAATPTASTGPGRGRSRRRPRRPAR